MDIGRQLLSDVIVFSKYAQYVPEVNRREVFDEIVGRNRKMHLDKFPQLREEIIKAYKKVYEKKVLPSMRSIQFAGKAISINPARIFNCSYCPVEHIDTFSEAMFLLLSGCGFGYSVQFHHISKLPEIRHPTRKRRFLIADSIEGWADSIKALIRAFLDNKPLPVFDFSDIRKKGARLITSGGKAPGPEPLKECLFKLQQILEAKENGSKLTSLEIHDMLCHIADCVLSGGIRRAAMIAFFSLDDVDMLTCKAGNWYELNPQRGRCNNSAVALRSRITEEDFNNFWKYVSNNGTGEPAIIFTNDVDDLSNPCLEIKLKPYQFCNLCELNASLIETQEELNECVEAAALIGTLQASYTDFHYLRDIWRQTTEKEALLGIGITGLASKQFLNLDRIKAAKIVLKTNEKIADLININKAARATCIKPSGTTSSLLGCSSGVHSWYAPYYLRRIRLNKNEAVYNYLKDKFPMLIEDDVEKPFTQVVLSIPIAAPSSAITRNQESPLDLLERVKQLNVDWIKPGHRSGNDTHNVSVTVSIKENEWDIVGKWMWENRSFYSGISTLPFDGGTYRQLPFEEITEEKYFEIYNQIKDIEWNMSDIKEIDDNTDLQGELACAGGGCAI